MMKAAILAILSQSASMQEHSFMTRHLGVPRLKSIYITMIQLCSFHNTTLILCI